MPITEKTAYFVIEFNYMPVFKTSHNLDENGRHKYYLIKEKYQTLHRTQRMPRDSPYTHIFKDIYDRVLEAGLYDWWVVDYYYVKKTFGFTIFPKLVHGKSESIPLQVHNLYFAFLILIIGLGISFLVFLVERILIVKRERTQFESERKRKTELLMILKVIEDEDID